MCTRAEQRKHRLLEMENEQRLEDFEALKMTDVSCSFTPQIADIDYCV